MTAPPKLVLTFNGRVVAHLSSVMLVGGPRNTRVLLSSPQAPDADTLVYALPTLAPGQYRAEWKVRAVDGQVTDGILRFTVIEAGDDPPRRARDPRAGRRAARSHVAVGGRRAARHRADDPCRHARARPASDPRPPGRCRHASLDERPGADASPARVRHRATPHPGDAGDDELRRARHRALRDRGPRRAGRSTRRRWDTWRFIRDDGEPGGRRGAARRPGGGEAGVGPRLRRSLRPARSPLALGRRCGDRGRALLRGHRRLRAGRGRPRGAIPGSTCSAGGWAGSSSIDGCGSPVRESRSPCWC